MTDSPLLYTKFNEIVHTNNLSNKKFFFGCTIKNDFFKKNNVRKILVKNQINTILNSYKMIISIHCKQIFPKELVNNIPCINVHPGYNPDNRGYFPQDISIINDTNIGATIHIMDEKLDHGSIIDREKVNKYIWDTSETLYKRIVKSEINLINKNLKSIIDGSYSSKKIKRKGHLFLKSDFNDICKIDLNETGSFLKFYNRLRALSHENYKNAYFLDENGEKVFLKIEITKE